MDVHSLQFLAAFGTTPTTETEQHFWPKLWAEVFKVDMSVKYMRPQILVKHVSACVPRIECFAEQSLENYVCSSIVTGATFAAFPQKLSFLIFLDKLMAGRC